MAKSGALAGLSKSDIHDGNAAAKDPNATVSPKGNPQLTPPMAPPAAPTLGGPEPQPSADEGAMAAGLAAGPQASESHLSGMTRPAHNIPQPGHPGMPGGNVTSADRLPNPAKAVAAKARTAQRTQAIRTDSQGNQTVTTGGK